MDYETPDGSQFSLRAIWRKDSSGNPVCYTSVSAYVEGVAYISRLDDAPDQIDEADLLPGDLEPVPLECIHPLFRDGFTLAPTFDPSLHYLKAPSFTYEDCRPGNTFVADCVLNEVSVLERLRTQPHPHIARYHGCMVKDGRITFICLERYPSSLTDQVLNGLTDVRKETIMEGIKNGVFHLHSMGLAHNDVNPGNICIDAGGEVIIIDFDSCLPFGETLVKGSGCNLDGPCPTSSKENDLRGLQLTEDFLQTPNEAAADPSDANEDYDGHNFSKSPV